MKAREDSNTKPQGAPDTTRSASTRRQKVALSRHSESAIVIRTSCVLLLNRADQRIEFVPGHEPSPEVVGLLQRAYRLFGKKLDVGGIAVCCDDFRGETAECKRFLNWLDELVQHFFR